ncbi:MAG: glycoside hydrolase family 2 protein [Acutalibacteraceae bacterium]|jgi:beta-galactosidase/beta-glucuronidase
MTIPRPEHPQPQLYRENWCNLNGEWAFAIDNERSGKAKGWDKSPALPERIMVPFCPESRLSGIGHTDFMNAVWYSRLFDLSADETSGSVILHFGAVDYRCEVFINGEAAGGHVGGMASFALDITRFVHPGENRVTVYAEDDTRHPMQPTGKQSAEYASFGCVYTRTTGIWQTVWLEFVPNRRIVDLLLTPHPETASVLIEAQVNGAGTLTARAFYEGQAMGEGRVTTDGERAVLELPLAEKHLWEAGHGRLYDLELTFEEDRVQSYFGLRSICFDGMRWLLNGKPVFQRLVLDQGFYPDGIYTAPTDEALQRDISLSMAMGFNGARLHEKVFETRFLYHCDKAGYLVWGEYPNWGVDHSRPEAIYSILPEWLEVVNRDRNHPAVIGWCPFNETWDQAGHPQDNRVLQTVYEVTKAVDPTRPCIDTSGAYHVKTDVFCIHDYEQDTAVFREHYDRLMSDGTLFDPQQHRQTWHGEPVFLSEYGGIWWAPEQVDGWGYGSRPQSPEAFLDRFRLLSETLLGNDKMFGLCYTQLYDVEQEVNGLYTYDRQPKFPPDVIRTILAQPAAIEKE